MAITDFLGRNRGWIGSVLLLASWTAFLLPRWGRTTLVIASTAIMLAGVARVLADYKADRSQPEYDRVGKIQFGLAAATMLIVAILQFGFNLYGGQDGAPELMPLIALLNLPRSPRTPLQPEVAQNA